MYCYQLFLVHLFLVRFESTAPIYFFLAFGKSSKPALDRLIRRGVRVWVHVSLSIPNYCPVQSPIKILKWRTDRIDWFSRVQLHMAGEIYEGHGFFFVFFLSSLRLLFFHFSFIRCFFLTSLFLYFLLLLLSFLCLAKSFTAS